MWEQLQIIWPWWDMTAFTVGTAMVIMHWFVGLNLGILFDMCRKS